MYWKRGGWGGREGFGRTPSPPMVPPTGANFFFNFNLLAPKARKMICLKQWNRRRGEGVRGSEGGAG